MNNGSANTLIIPTSASVAFPINASMAIVMEGVGTTTVTATAGVTLNGVATGSADIYAQYAAVELLKRGVNSWIMFGAHGTVS